MGIAKLLGIVLVVIVSFGTYSILNDKVPPMKLEEDAWWGDIDRPDKEDTTIRRFPKINVPTTEIKELKQKLKNTRWPTDLIGGTFNDGFQATYMKEVVDYWLTKFDWRKQEAILNSFSHYVTNIEGIDVHYIHERSKVKDQNKEVIPILIVHGWPGSIWEFYKLIPMLTAANNSIRFEVVAPSIPGYGYSSAPRKQGFDQGDSARVFMKLMKRLGYERYYVQGGDWGALVTQIMAIVYPEQVIGIHTNMFPEPPLPKTYLKILIGWLFPSLIYAPGEAEMVYPFWDNIKMLLHETGYFHIQATKPDTVGLALTDSPVGLAGYILEKFSVWTNLSSRQQEFGGLTDKFTLDELLTNIMIYWTNQNVVSSMRYYKEFIRSPEASFFLAVEVSVPSGLAQFPNEVTKTPRTLAADKFTNIVQYSSLPRGGHFAAFEEPTLMADDIISFVTKVQQSP